MPHLRMIALGRDKCGWFEDRRLSVWSKTALALLALILLAIIGVGIASTGYPSALNIPGDPPTATRIDNVRIVSMAPDASRVQTGQSVLIIGGVVRAVAPAEEIDTPEGAQIIDGEGQTLLPGLIDAHVHVWDEAELAGYLAHGVTSVRNMSGMPFHLRLARRIESGRLLGPDLVTTGPILNSPGANAQINHVMVLTAEQARAAVRAQHAAGYRTVKVYSNLRREPYEAILDEARQLGMGVTGHTPEGERLDGTPYERPFSIAFRDILDDDFLTIEHTESIVWHGLRDELDQEAMRALANEIARADVVVTPTLIAHDNLVRVAQSHGAYLERPGVDTINPLLQAVTRGDYEYWSARDPEDYDVPRAAFYLAATQIMHEAGVRLIAGSDAGIFTNIPGSALTRELELLVGAGLTPYEALTAATVTAGPAIGLPDRGQIAPGFRANLILTQSDPLTDVSAVENPSAVMLGGVWLDADALERLRDGARQTSLIRSARRFIEAQWFAG